MRIYLYLFLLTFLLSCNNSSRNNITAGKDSLPEISNHDASIRGNFSTQRTLIIDTLLVPRFFEKYTQLAAYHDDVHRLYQNRQNRFAWFDESGLIEPAINLFNRLSNLHEEGLRKFPPYINELDSLLMNDQLADINNDLETELLLSSLYFYYASHVWEGMDESTVKAQEWYLPRKKVNAVDLLDSLLNNGGKVLQMEERPLYRQYYLLRDALKIYRELADKGGWPAIHTDQKKIVKGDSLAVIADIKSRLLISGDLSYADSSIVFDETLEAAVKKFQERHGLEVDGIIGAAMIRTMNIPVEKRIEQIMINMERCRWVPAQLNHEYLVVNIPDFKLYAFDGDSLLWSMNVVVGQALHKTVIFYGELKYVVFSPYWNVPNSIYKNEILPAMKRDPNYLARNNMEEYAHGVRQKPGPGNSLGLVKFLFPNSYNIYLHDTPSKNLFSKSSRAFSHGCIRVADPMFLSKFLLKDQPEWTEEKITAAMHSGKEKYITMKQTMPVYIAYLTSFVTSDGNLQFREDIYKRDQRMEKLILGE